MMKLVDPSSTAKNEELRFPILESKMALSVSSHSRNLITSISRLVQTSQEQDVEEDEGEASEQKQQNPPSRHFLFDLQIVCRDGCFWWNSFLLASNSTFLKSALLQSIDNLDEPVVLVLPDLTASTVKSMLECTVNVTVKRDTLSVNEQEVMKILGFDTLIRSRQQTSSPSKVTVAEKNQEDSSPKENDAPSEVIDDDVFEKEASGAIVCKANGCGKKFQRMLHFKRHFANHSKASQFVCEVCSKVFYHRDSLRLHQKYHQDVAAVVECEECGAKLNGRRALKCHVDTHHCSRMPCQFCGKMLKKRLLPRHLRALHPKEFAESKKRQKSKIKKNRVKLKHCCDHCEETFETLRELSHHKKESHEPPEPTIATENKPESLTLTSKNESSKTIADLILEDKRVPCPDCDKSFANIYNLRQHCQRFHNANIVVAKTFDCKVCGKKFSGTASRLRRHMREVHAENRFECQVCGHFFPVKASLERHLNTVHRPVKLECPFCQVVVVHLTPHLMTSHSLDSLDARTMASELAGKLSARTNLTSEMVISRRSEK